jgi:hypothetical protein
MHYLMVGIYFIESRFMQRPDRLHSPCSASFHGRSSLNFGKHRGFDQPRGHYLRQVNVDSGIPYGCLRPTAATC